MTKRSSHSNEINLPSLFYTQGVTMMGDAYLFQAHHKVSQGASFGPLLLSVHTHRIYQIHAMLKIKNSIDQVLWSHHSSHSKIKIWQFINIKLKECSNYKPPESRNLNCGHNDVSPFQECGQFNRPSWRTGSNKNSYVNPFALTWTLKHYLLKKFITCHKNECIWPKRNILSVHNIIILSHYIENHGS